MGVKLEELKEEDVPRSPEQIMSPDQQLIVTFTEFSGGSFDTTVRAKLQTAEDKQFIASLGKAQYAVFSPDSRLLLTLSPEGKATLFNSDGELLRRFRSPEKVIHAEFEEEEGVMRLKFNRTISWAIRNFGIKEFAGHQASVLRVAFSGGKEEPLLLTSIQREVVRLWKVTGQLVAEVAHPYASKQLNTTFARFSPDGQYFATWSDFTAEDGYPKLTRRVKEASVRLWDRQGKMLKELEFSSAILEVIISPDSRHLLIFPTDTAPVLLSRDGEQRHEYASGRYYYSAAFVPGRPQFLTIDEVKARSDKAYRGELWDFEGNLVKTFQAPEAGKGSMDRAFVTNPVFSPDGIYFLSYDLVTPNASTAYLWHFEEGKVKHSFDHQSRIFSVVFSPGERQHILTASRDGTAKLWNLEGNRLQTLDHEGPVYSARFSPDGRLIVTASADGTARLWDLEGNLLADLNRHGGEVYSAVFSPDGRYICTGCEDGSARLWPTPFAIKDWMDGKDAL